jgi:hypothetical protein
MVMKITKVTASLSYVALVFVIISTNLIVFTISPGNWIVAIISSTTLIAIFLPGDSTTEEQDAVIEASNVEVIRVAQQDEPLTIEDIAKDLGPPELTEEDLKIHSMLGNVFNTMARNAKEDLEFKKTEKVVKPNQESASEAENEKLITVPNRESRDQFGIESPEYDNEEDEMPYNVRLDVDLDGKLHYIFEEVKDDDERYQYEDEDEKFDEIENNFVDNFSSDQEGTNEGNEEAEEFQEWLSEVVDDLTWRLSESLFLDEKCVKSIKKDMLTFIGEKINNIGGM